MEPFPRILFPIPISTNESVRKLTTTKNDTNDAKHQNHHHHHSCEQQRNLCHQITTDISWQGISPLEMTQRIATMVLQQNPDPRCHPPLLIDASFLASETQEIIHSPPLLSPLPKDGKYPSDKLQEKMHYRSSHGPPASTVSFDHEEQSQLPNAVLAYNDGNRKRGRDIFMQNDEKTHIPNTLNHDPTDSNTHHSLVDPWDLSYLISYDNDPHIATEFVEEITPLILRLESMPGMKRSLPSYRRLRCDVWLQYKHIFGNDRCEGGLAVEKRRSHLDSMYSSTLEKMDALLVMTERMNEEAARQVTPAGRNANNHPPSTNRKQKSEQREYSKKEFTEYMNRWLKLNWTNPYPDDEGLANIALACGTTTTVVSNWLINARTRKWRPAIIRAYENERPAEFLLEDSIRIFEGNELREIVSGAGERKCGVTM